MDKLETERESLFTVRSMVPRFLKALAKMAISCIVFFALSMVMAPVQSIFSFQSVFMAFFAVQLFFIFVIEITRGTVYQHVFGIASSMIVVAYFAYILNVSVISFSVEQASFMVDLRFFFYVLILGGVLGFAKSVLQLLN
jgi:hypothetical protein